MSKKADGQKTGTLSRMFAGKNKAEESVTAEDARDSDPAGNASPSSSAPASTQQVSRGATEAGRKKGWFSRLRQGLAKTSSRLNDGVTGIFTRQKLDDQTLEDLEDLLIQADLGVETAARITETLSADRYDKSISPEEVRDILAKEIAGILRPVATPLEIDGTHRPHVFLVIGVNGTGKTTTIGKLTSQFKAKGKSVMLAAGDTFRAAAIDQLRIWGERTNAEVISNAVGSDAASLAFEALGKAGSNGTDILLMDTAGRLQNKADLMAELEKIIRAMRKVDATAPHDVLLVLDATTGQNALQQVEIFKQRAGVTGLIMTKLDGTARGGILVAIAAKYQMPVHAIGIGEGIDDLQPFNADAFASAVVGIANDADMSI